MSNRLNNGLLDGHGRLGPFVSVGRVETHPGGGWQVRVRNGGEDTVFVGHDGQGLTKDEAEQVLDRLDGFIAQRN